VRPTTIKNTILNVGLMPTATSRDRAAGGRLLDIWDLARDYMMRLLFNWLCLATLGSVLRCYALHGCHLTIWSNMDNRLGEWMDKAFENHDSARPPDHQQDSDSYQYGGRCNQIYGHNAPFEVWGRKRTPPAAPSVAYCVTDAVRCQALDAATSGNDSTIRPLRSYFWLLLALSSRLLASQRHAGVGNSAASRCDGPRRFLLFWILTPVPFHSHLTTGENQP
jgi:hypothetical protein